MSSFLGNCKFARETYFTSLRTEYWNQWTTISVQIHIELSSTFFIIYDYFVCVLCYNDKVFESKKEIPVDFVEMVGKQSIDLRGW